MSNKRKWIQPIRLFVQVALMGAFIYGLCSSRDISGWLVYGVLLLGVLSCGWVCPLGTVQDLAYKLGRLLHLPVLRMPQRVQQYLQLSRYILYFIGTLGLSIAALHATRSLGTVMKGKEIATAALVVLIVTVVIGMFFNRPFCNYACAGGAKNGLLSVLRIIGIRRDTERCSNCKLCTKACPMNIDVASTEFVRHPNCIGCMSCVSACPKGCIAYKHMPCPNKQTKNAK